MVRSGYLSVIHPAQQPLRLAILLHSMINVISAASLYYCGDAFSIYGVSLLAKDTRDRRERKVLRYSIPGFFSHASVHPQPIFPCSSWASQAGGKSLHVVSRLLSIIPPSSPNRDANCKE